MLSYFYPQCSFNVNGSSMVTSLKFSSTIGSLGLSGVHPMNNNNSVKSKIVLLDNFKFPIV